MNFDFSKKMVISKPTTPSRRHRRSINKVNLQKTPLIKGQISGKVKRSFGRNNSGRIVSGHKGGGNKRRYRILSFTRDFNSTGIVLSIEFDPNRSANIASICDVKKNKFSYILAPKHLKVGDIVKCGQNVNAQLGNSLPIYKIRIGSYIHNVAMSRSKPSKLSRSAGTFCQVKETSTYSAKVSLPSGEIRLVSPECHATIGVVSNEFFFLTRLSKAGQSRWLNRRPTVRGVAMNPIDHPHGGGEGRKSGKGLSPWGKVVKQGKTSRSQNLFTFKRRT